MKDLNLIAEPTEEELRQVTRELKFVEASNENPRFLSLLKSRNITNKATLCLSTDFPPPKFPISETF